MRPEVAAPRFMRPTPFTLWPSSASLSRSPTRITDVICAYNSVSWQMRFERSTFTTCSTSSSASNACTVHCTSHVARDRLCHRHTAYLRTLTSRSLAAHTGALATQLAMRALSTRFHHLCPHQASLPEHLRLCSPHTAQPTVPCSCQAFATVSPESFGLCPMLRMQPHDLERRGRYQKRSVGPSGGKALFLSQR